MGSLDQPTGSAVKREIEIYDVTAYNTTQVKNYFNNNLGPVGWRIIQFIQIGSSRYILCEREVQ